MDDLDATIAAPEPTPGTLPAGGQLIENLGKFTLLRADDMLELEVEFSGPGMLLLPKTGFFMVDAGHLGGTLTVRLPPQHAMEFASRYVFGRSTLLRFRVPPHAAIPVSTQGVLGAMKQFELITDPAIGIDPPLPEVSPGTPAPPAPPEPPPAGALAVDPATITELKVSSRMGLSPRGGASRFVHAALPVAHNGASELWHTRLARLTTAGRLVEGKTDLVGLRNTDTTAANATWNNDMAKVLLTSKAERDEIVRQSRLSGGALRARQLMLSPLGAWTDLRGRWPGSTTVQSWRHELNMGRDHRHQIALLGRLYPFGHRAIRFDSTERVLKGDNGSFAKLVTRSLIAVRDAVEDFGGTGSVQRQFPFVSVEILTAETPAGTAAFFSGDTRVLMRGSGPSARPFAYRCRAVDRAGNEVLFRMPLIFVPNTFTDYSTLHNDYATAVDAADSDYVMKLDAQRVAVATPGGNVAAAVAAGAADTAAANATEVVLQIAKLAGVAGGTAGFQPVVSEMLGRVPAIEQFGAAPQPLVMRYADAYKSGAAEFGTGNVGEIVLAITGAPKLAMLDEKNANALVSALGFTPSALSRRLGPVGGTAQDIADLALGSFDPAKFLGDVFSKLTLFGVFPLKDIVKASHTLAEAPQTAIRFVDGLRTQTFHWSTEVFSPQRPQVEFLAGRLRPQAGRKPQLTVDVVASADLATRETHVQTTCKLTGIELGIGLAGSDLVVVPVDEFSFVSQDARKPVVDVKLGNVRFGGMLVFLSKLAGLIDKAGFSKLSAIDLLPDGVLASFSLPLPPVAVGVFVMENIRFGARFDLPFKDRKPQLTFDFATFDNPFRLTVLALGGSGFLGLTLDTSGLVRAEAALEFGAAVSVNLGIARASVSIMGGVYFQIEGLDVVLTGYVRVQGKADVLGIVSVSVELFIGLTYDFSDDSVAGEAEIVAKFRVLFVKKTVRVPFKVKYGGAGNANAVAATAAAAALPAPQPPGFSDLMDPVGWIGQRPWDAYCLAFAEN